MVNKNEISRLKLLAEQAAQANSCELYDLEFVNGPMGRTLRVFISSSSAENKGSVSLNDCSSVSSSLSLLLDVEDVIAGGAYNLEVSSPGIERKLKTKNHFEGAVGETIKLNLSVPLGMCVSEANENISKSYAKTKSLIGFLEKINLETIIIKDKKENRIEIPFSKLDKASVVFE